jgi:hypothetical protein
LIAQEERGHRVGVFRPTEGTEDDDALDVALLTEGAVREGSTVLVEEL